MENSASAEVILALIISSSAVVAARLVPAVRGLPVARVLMVVCKEQGGRAAQAVPAGSMVLKVLAAKAAGEAAAVAAAQVATAVMAAREQQAPTVATAHREVMLY
jgi:hypothetical protein